MPSRYPFPTVPALLLPLYRVRVLRKWTTTVWRLWARIRRRRLRLVCVRGQYFVIDPFDAVGRKLAVWRCYEPDQMCRLYDYSRELAAPIFIDVGANNGAYSLFFARDQRFREIVSFEPDPQNFAFLSFHRAINGGDPRLRLHAVAASDAAGTASFWAVHGVNRGASRITDEQHGGLRAKFAGRSIEVKTARLDELLTYRGQELVIKIDVEGHEVPALRGMERLVRENRCVIQVEAYAGDESGTAALLAAWGCERLGAVGNDAYYRS